MRRVPRTQGSRYAGPLLGEPLPIELANTEYLVRGQPKDGLRAGRDLTAWLREIRPRLDTPVTDHELLAVDSIRLSQARSLRSCIRALTAAAVHEVRPDPGVIDELNRHARVALRWHELRWNELPRVETCGDTPLVATALCEIAQTAVDLFASPQRLVINMCAAPDCILYFCKDHPRREWCSTGCGNRVRAARHYDRTRRRI